MGTYSDNKQSQVSYSGNMDFKNLKIISDAAIKELVNIKVEIEEKKPELNIYIPEIKIPEINFPRIEVPEAKVLIEVKQEKIEIPQAINNITVEPPKIELKFHVKHIYIGLFLQSIFILGMMYYVLFV